MYSYVIDLVINDTYILFVHTYVVLGNDAYILYTIYTVYNCII